MPQSDAVNGEQNEQRPRKSSLGWCVLLGAVLLGVVGAFTPQPSDLNAVTGAIYGFMLGALAGVINDRCDARADRANAKPRR